MLVLQDGPAVHAGPALPAGPVVLVVPAFIAAAALQVGFLRVPWPFLVPAHAL